MINITFFCRTLTLFITLGLMFAKATQPIPPEGEGLRQRHYHPCKHICEYLCNSVTFEDAGLR